MTEAEAYEAQQDLEEERLAKRRAKARARSEAKLLERIAKCGRLEKTICETATNGSFFSLPGGQVVSRALVSRLIERGALVPCNDGLFGDAQTFVPA